MAENDNPNGNAPASSFGRVVSQGVPGVVAPSSSGPQAESQATPGAVPSFLQNQVKEGQEANSAFGRSLKQLSSGDVKGALPGLVDRSLNTALAGLGAENDAAKAVKAAATGNDSVRSVAKSYLEGRGQSLVPHTMVEVDPSRGARIAQAFEQMPHAPNDPAVKSAYQALIDETKAQWEQIQKATGLKVSKIEPGQANPYPTSKAMMEDIAQNNHLHYYPSELGFGEAGGAGSDHPLMTTKVDLNGEQVPANDLFRIVHDYFGHAKEGVGFGPKGEENAFQVHARMFSPEARKALATETRGQNSWVNFGPYGEANRANPGATRFADQKAGLLPDWVHSEGVQGLPADRPQLVHYSRADAPLAEVDPQFMGNGAAGKERMRGDDRLPRSYYYDAGTRPEDVVMSGAKHVHYVNAPDKVLDLASKEAAPLIAKAGDMNELEQMIKAQGYAGYRNTQPGSPLPNAVALFDKQPVVRSHAMDAEHFQAASKFPVTKDMPLQMLGHDEVEQYFQKVGHGQTYSGGTDGGGTALPGFTKSGLPQGQYRLQEIDPRSAYRQVGGKVPPTEPFAYGPDEESARAFAQRGSDFPAIIVKPHPTTPGVFEIMDGTTRARAAVLRGQDKIKALVHQAEPVQAKAAVPNKAAKPAEVAPTLNSAGMFSKAENIVQNKMGGAASPQQILGMLKEVKPEELEHLGLNDFLAGKSKVSKQELLDHIAANKLELKEKVLGQVDPEFSEKVDNLKRLVNEHSEDSRLAKGDYQREQLNLAEALRGKGHSTDEAMDIARRLGTADGFDPAKRQAAREWLQNNYPELDADRVIKAADGAADARAKYFQTRDRLDTFSQEAPPATKYDRYTTPGGENYREILHTLPSDMQRARDAGNTELAERLRKERVERAKTQGAQDYKSSHWDEPNVLAHERVSDFTLPSGERVRHSHEFQSDWHQEGRKKGYKGESGAGVPDAPLKKSWHEYAFKRALTDAVEKDFDRVSWDTGATNADRYSLRKSIEELHYDPKEERLVGFTEGGDTAVDKSGVKPADLEGIIGKEAAEKLMAQPAKKSGVGFVNPVHSLEGAQLDLGGEGMKGFYDKILPEYAQKLVKKWGGKVEQIELPKPYDARAERGPKSAEKFGGTGTKVWSIKLTPEMKAAIKKGLPMFAVGGVVGGAAMAPQARAQGVQYFANGGMAMAPQNNGPVVPGATPQAQSTAPGMAPPAPAAVNVVDPDTGELGSIPAHQLQDAVNQGFRVASPDETSMHFRHQKYGGFAQGAAAFGEGAAEGLAGPLGTAALTGMGDNPEDMLGRREEHGMAHMAGQVTGLAAPALLTAGAGALARSGVAGAAGVASGIEALSPMTQAGFLDMAGSAGAKALGLAAPESTLAKIGSSAVKSAIENAVFQTGDEASKMILQDPSQTAQTAAINVGLAGVLGGVIGGGIGSAKPLYDATLGKGMGGILTAIQKRVGGIEGVVADPISEAIARTGIELAPEIRASLSSDPKVRQMFETLSQSDTTAAGAKFQEAVGNFRRDMEGALVEALGRDPETLSGQDYSKYEIGKAIANQMADEFHAKLSPEIAKFESFREKYADLPIAPSVAQKEAGMQAEHEQLMKQLAKAQSQAVRAQKSGSVEAAVEAAAKVEELQQKIRMNAMQGQAPGAMDHLAEKIAQVADREGWFKLADSDIANHVNKVLKALPQQATLSDIGKLMTSISDTMQKDRLNNGPLYRAGGILKSLLKDVEGETLERAIGEKQGEAALAEFKSARAGYRHMSELKEAMDERLHVRGSTSGFAKNLREMGMTDGEAVLNRLSGKNDANVLALLQEHFPKTAELVRQSHLEDLVQGALKKAKNEQLVSPTHIIGSVEKMSPELRQFALGDKAEKVQAVGTLLDQLNSAKHNFSNTARTLDKLMSYVPGSAIGLVGMLTGHNPALAMMMPTITKYLSRDIPDAARLSMLKFLGSSREVDGGAFKVAADYIQHAMDGQKLMAKSAKAVFTAEKDVLPESLKVKEKDRAALDAQLKRVQTDPEALTKVPGGTAHYMPEHAEGMSEFAAQSAQFLNSLRPSTEKAMPLDGARVVSRSERTQFDRALTIAQQPLTILEHIKKGTITPTDVQVFKTLYPDLYPKLTNQLMSEMNDMIAKGGTVPYRVRLSMSMFLAQPLDSTLTPAGIAGAQPNVAPQGPQGSVPSNSKSTKALSKMGQEAMTKTQSREGKEPGK